MGTIGTMLRDYQTDMLERVRAAWDSGKRSVLVQMPAGTGKTVLLAEIIRGVGNVLIVAHRRELIEQIRQTIASLGLEGVRVESIQKLSRNSTAQSAGCPVPHGEAEAFTPSLVVVDEAHHAMAKTYRVLWERWPEARFLGLTATPCRLSGEGLSDLFDELLQSHPIQWFIDKGWLSDFEYVSARPDSLMLHHVGQLRKRGVDGDYQSKEMATVLDVPESIAHLYDSYQTFAWGKKGIVYAIDQTHARHIAAYYTEKGVGCAVIDSKTPSGIRSRLVDDYRQHALDVLVNVDIFGEGFDVPEVEFIQLARPTLSLSKYLQQVGRGMRVSRGKDCVLILDNVGLYQTFGLPTDERDWHQMFLGQRSGKGSRGGNEKPIIIREDRDDKMLVNLEMVRIKRRGEKHEGFEIFMQHGFLGLMQDGRVVQQPAFVKIKRLEQPLQFLATYPYQGYKSRVTVLDKTGMNMKANLYGKVRRENGVFIGQSLEGRTVYWDAVSDRYYRQKPEFMEVNNISVVRVGDKCYLRSRDPKYINKSFGRHDIYFSGFFTILGDMLVLKDKPRQPYQVICYMGDKILVKGESRFNSNKNAMQLLTAQGVFYQINKIDENTYLRGTRKPDLNRLWLRQM